MIFHIHLWSKWQPFDHYRDTSYGGAALSTQLVRFCRCGDVRSKGLYGVVLDLPEPTDEEGDAA